MKQKDIAIIIVVASFAAFLSFFVANKVFVNDKSRTQTAQIIDPIRPEMSMPDERFFNAESINPTRNTTATGTNETPFNDSGQ